MSFDKSFYSQESKIQNESDSLINRVDSLDSNLLGSVSNKEDSAVNGKVSVIRIALPADSTESKEFQKNRNLSQPVTKKGRPSAQEISRLRDQVHDSKNRLVCPYCVRGFKIKKGLNTHLRTHTNQKPYMCTYPRCNIKFTQSSHLDTHIRLHTKEKPFCCPIEGCNIDFAHQSRKCNLHMCNVKRKTTKYGVTDIEDFSTRPIDEQEWLIQYFQNKENKVSVIQKKQKANETSSDTQRKKTLVSNSQMNQQNKGYEHIMHEAHRAKRRSDITETTEINCIAQQNETVVFSSNRIEQSEGDEHIIQETNRAKRKRSDITESSNDYFQYVENIDPNPMDTENSSSATDESMFSETESSEEEKRLDVAKIMINMLLKGAIRDSSGDLKYLN